MYFLLGSWQVEGCSLLSSHIVVLGVITAPICRVDKAEIFPPPQEPVIPLQICMDPLTWVVGIDINPFPWFPSFQGRVTVGCSGSNRNGSLLSRFYKPGDFCLSGSRAWHSWEPISFTQEDGLLFQSGRGSQFLLNKEASLTSSPLRSSMGPCIAGALWQLCIGCHSWLQMPLHGPSTPWPKLVSSPVSWSRNSGGQRQGRECPVDQVHVAWVGCTTTQRPLVATLAA